MGTAKDRTIDPFTRAAGQLLHQFRLCRGRRSAGGRRDRRQMTVAEVLAAYCDIEERMTGVRQWRSESFIHRIERGQERLTPLRLVILSRALKLTPWERALVEEVAGYRGLRQHLINELGVVLPDFLREILSEDGGELTLAALTMAEFEFAVREWVKAAKENIKRRLRAELEAEIRAEVVAEFKAKYRRHLQRGRLRLLIRLRADVLDELRPRLEQSIRQEVEAELREQYDAKLHETLAHMQAEFDHELISAKLTLLRRGSSGPLGGAEDEAS